MNKIFLGFPGAKIISSLPSDYISWGTYYQFCYVDASDCIQGRSESFQIELDSEPYTSMSSASFENITFFGNNDDFIEVSEEDDEIVVIKPRTAFLQEELHRITSSANDKAVSNNVLLLLSLSFYWLQNELHSFLLLVKACYAFVRLAVLTGWIQSSL
jgi:hypothetical protein